MSDDGDRGQHNFWARWRANFLTGLVVVAPLYLTIWLIWSFVSIVDYKVETLLPAAYGLTWIDFPGYGLVIFVVFTALIGAMAKNLFAAQLIGWGERMLDRLPIVRSIYNAIKQIAQTVLVQSQSSFEKACLVEYPRKGVWAVAFISTETRGELIDKVDHGPLLSVFLPTTPNPTSGFLLFVPASEVIELDMTVEEAAKLIISAGLVSPERLPARRPEDDYENVPAAAE